MKRKIFAALIAVMMVVSMLPLSVMAVVETPRIDAHFYVYKNGNFDTPVASYSQKIMMGESVADTCGEKLEKLIADNTGAYGGKVYGWYCTDGTWNQYMAGKAVTEYDLTETTARYNGWTNIKVMIYDLAPVVFYDSYGEGKTELYSAKAEVNKTIGEAGIAIPTPTKEGYTFTNWRGDWEGNKFADEAAVNAIKVNGWTNLFAEWEQNDYALTIYTTSFGERENLWSGTAHMGDEVTLADKIAIPTGYMIDEWEAAAADGTYTMPAGNAAIKVTFKPITYTLQFNAGIKDGVVLGTFENGTRFYRVVSNIEDTTPITAEIPTRTGYELLGWKVAGIKDTTFDAGYEFTVAELLELGATVSYYDEDCKQPYFKFTAVWDASDVTVEYTFATEADRELPSEVTALVPVDENVYHAGDIVTVPTLAATTVETEEGTWTFVDWNLKEGATEFTVQPEDAENGILITGYWSFTEKVEEPETEEEPKPEKPEPKFDMPKLNLRSIVIDTTEGGKTSVASGRCYGALGSTYRLAITPDEGFEIDEVLVNGKPAEVNKNNKVSFVVKGNTYVEVSFVEIEG